MKQTASISLDAWTEIEQHAATSELLIFDLNGTLDRMYQAKFEVLEDFLRELLLKVPSKKNIADAVVNFERIYLERSIQSFAELLKAVANELRPESSSNVAYSDLAQKFERNRVTEPATIERLAKVRRQCPVCVYTSQSRKLIGELQSFESIDVTRHWSI